MPIPVHAVKIAKAQSEGMDFKAGFINGWDWAKCLVIRPSFGSTQMFLWRGLFIWWRRHQFLAQGDSLSFEYLGGNDYLVANHRVGTQSIFIHEAAPFKPGPDGVGRIGKATKPNSLCRVSRRKWISNLSCGPRWIVLMRRFCFGGPIRVLRFVWLLEIQGFKLCVSQKNRRFLWHHQQ